MLNNFDKVITVLAEGKAEKTFSYWYVDGEKVKQHGTIEANSRSSAKAKVIELAKAAGGKFGDVFDVEERKKTIPLSAIKPDPTVHPQNGRRKYDL